VPIKGAAPAFANPFFQEINAIRCAIKTCTGGGVEYLSRPLLPRAVAGLAPVCAGNPLGILSSKRVHQVELAAGQAEKLELRNMQKEKSYAVGRRAGLLVAAALCLGWSVTSAQDKPAKQKGWETTAAAGVTLTRGNSETFLATLSLDTKRKWQKDEAIFGANAGYGEATVGGVDQKNTEFLRGFGQYNRLFNERLYGGLRLDGEYDGIAGVDYRFRVSPLLGYYLIKNAKTTLNLEVGPSVVFENLKTKPSDTYYGMRAGERFEHKLTATTKIWQSFEYIPNVERWVEDYLLIGEAGIDTAITKKLSLRAVFQDTYDSEPAAGRKNNDMRLITGLAYKL
jgi:putative salt-induced outer membrane protein YdiY